MIVCLLFSHNKRIENHNHNTNYSLKPIILQKGKMALYEGYISWWFFGAQSAEKGTTDYCQYFI